MIVNGKGIWPFVIIGIVVIGVVFYVVENFLISFGIIKPHITHRFVKVKKNHIDAKFKELYNYIENKYAKDLEIDRRTLIKSFCICFILFMIAFFIFIFLKNKLDIKGRGGIFELLFIPTVFYYTHNYKKYNRNYVENYKEKIIKNLLEYSNSQLSYNKYGRKGLVDLYLDAQFLDNQFNNFVSDDYIEGYNEDGNKIEMCNFALENVNTKGEFLNIVNEGIFSVSQLNNIINGEVRIKKNNYFPNNINKVEMDSNEFEKYFDVYSKSNILAMEILTHDLMEELVQFYNTYKINFELVIKNDRIYIRFDTGVMFEPNILRKSNDMNTLWVYYSVLNFVTDVTIKINKLIKDIQV